MSIDGIREAPSLPARFESFLGRLFFQFQNNSRKSMMLEVLENRYPLHPKIFLFDSFQDDVDLLCQVKLDDPIAKDCVPRIGQLFTGAVSSGNNLEWSCFFTDILNFRMLGVKGI